MTEIIGEVMGYNKTFVWIRVPYLFAHRVLTLPRATLKRGFATAKEVNMLIDYDTLRIDGRYYVADVEILSVSTTRENQDLDTPEGAVAS